MQKNFREMTIGDRLKYAREEAGKTQDYFAKKAGVARNTIGNYENGLTKSIPLEILQVYHRITGASYDFLLDGIEESNHELVKKFEQLSPRDKRAIETMINFFLPK